MGMVGRVYAVAINTFREAVRDRVLYGVVAAAVGVLLFTLALAELSLDQQERVIVDVGMAAISLFSVASGVFLGSSLLYKEIERKTLYVILPKPIRREEFLLGKYAGILLTGVVFLSLTGGIQLWIAGLRVAEGAARWLWLAPLLAGGLLGLGAWRFSRHTSVLLPWSALWLVAMWAVAYSLSVSVEVIASMLWLTFLELSVVVAIATLFSSFSTPFLTGLFTLGVWIVGRSADDMMQIKSKAIAPFVRDALQAIVPIIPNTNLYVPGRHLLSQENAGSYLLTTSGYTVLYAVVVLIFACLIFRRRDFV